MTPQTQHNVDVFDRWLRTGVRQDEGFGGRPIYSDGTAPGPGLSGPPRVATVPVFHAPHRCRGRDHLGVVGIRGACSWATRLCLRLFLRRVFLRECDVFSEARMTVKELRDALKGVSGKATVCVMVDSLDVREVVNVFIDQDPSEIERELGEYVPEVTLELEEPGYDTDGTSDCRDYGESHRRVWYGCLRGPRDSQGHPRDDAEGACGRQVE